MTTMANTLSTSVVHVLGPGKLKVGNARLAFTTGKGSPTRLDPRKLQTILCYGNVGVTDDAMTLLFRHGVQTAWLSPGGNRFRGRLVGGCDSSVVLRMAQHKIAASPTLQLRLARRIVADKIESQIEAARHYRKQGKQGAAEALTALEPLGRAGKSAESLESLRGVEGMAAKAWFGLLGKLFAPPWTFSKRVRRPPTDPVNALLSLGYMFLTQRMTARCQAEGLETALGALHEFRPGRPSLACDLIEPLRTPLTDRWVIGLCNQKQVQPSDFEKADDQGVRLTQEKFPAVLADWEQYWSSADGDTRLDQTVGKFIEAARRISGESFSFPDEED